MRARPERSSAIDGLLDVVEVVGAEALDGVDGALRRPALVGVGAERDVGADGLPDAADDLDVGVGVAGAEGGLDALVAVGDGCGGLVRGLVRREEVEEGGHRRPVDDAAEEVCDGASCVASHRVEGGGLETEAEGVAGAGARGERREDVVGDGGVQAERGGREVVQHGGDVGDAGRASWADGGGLADADDAVVHVHPHEERVASGLGGVERAVEVAEGDAHAAPFEFHDLHSAAHYARSGGARPMFPPAP